MGDSQGIAEQLASAGLGDQCVVTIRVCQEKFPRARLKPVQGQGIGSSEKQQGSLVNTFAFLALEYWLYFSSGIP